MIEYEANREGKVVAARLTTSRSWVPAHLKQVLKALGGCRVEIPAGSSVSAPVIGRFAVPLRLEPSNSVADDPQILNLKKCAPRGEDYPRAALSSDQTGSTEVRYLVSAEGALVIAEVSRSGGSQALDLTTLKKSLGCQFAAGRDSEGRATIRYMNARYIWTLQ